MTHLRVTSIILLASVGACGGADRPGTAPLEAPAAAATAFPSAGELARLAAAPAPALTSGAIDLASWALLGPFPDVIEAAAPEPTAWSGLFADGVAAGTLTATADLHCVARELGRFYLQHGAQPAAALRRHVEGWCGTTAAGVDVMFLSGDVATSTSDDEVFAGWRANADDMVATVTAAGAAQIGVWFGRDGSRAVLAVSRGLPQVDVEPITLTPSADGQVTVRGTLRAPADRLRILVNQGALGVAECTLDAAVPLPRFAARCAIAPDDATAWIEVSAVPPGRLLGKVVLSVLARRDAAARSYALMTAAPLDDGVGPVAAALADQVNAARQRGAWARWRWPRTRARSPRRWRRTTLPPRSAAIRRWSPIGSRWG